ncbi:MAG: 23S rRNA (adenine(2503)-C(2))-methyltransferase RlmN [Candidatus Bipolaricaulis sp.]|jgi:23S rRNA (adenine2503-C2)-methyltransferase|nr:23S rRNA (adenine(2503)-C(2))-methyltransferase RlmN [Candidatus Bipolaricaulis sp.]
MNIEKLAKVLEALPKYRVKQAKEAIFKNLIPDWNKASFLPLALRQELNEKCPLDIKAEALVSKNKDSVKARITLEDGLLIESVLMRHKDGRNTVCVSSQVGCPLGCGFCATGLAGFKRNLTPMEIVEQVIFFARYLKRGGKKVTNVTFMGMGEPFLNYDNVLKACRIINSKDKLGIGARNISISTAGIIEGIEKFAKEGTQINLAISLHAPNNELRSRLMPINKRYHLERVLDAVDSYIKKTKRQVMFEYLLIKDVNDTDANAKDLARIMRNPLYYVNLILYNPTMGNSFRPSTTERVKKFKEILKKNKIVFSQRFRFGQDIKAACGQFAGEKK